MTSALPPMPDPYGPSPTSASDATAEAWLARWLQRHYPDKVITEPQDVVMRRALNDFKAEMADHLPTWASLLAHWRWRMQREEMGLDG